MATCSPVDEKDSPLSNQEIESLGNVTDAATNELTEPKSPKSDERYSYTQRDEFTSEVNKVEINNIPRFCGYTQLKSFFKRYKLTPLKLKIVRSRPKHSFAFATFHTSEEKQLALDRMNGEILKGQKIFLKPARPRSDPIHSRPPSAKGGEAGPPPSEEEQSASLLRAVTPLWDVPYSEQLERKSDELKQNLDEIQKELGGMRTHNAPRKQDITMDEIRGSVLTSGYRNKNEFTCGRDLQGRRCVGFRLGAYKKGSWTVASPHACIHVPKEVLEIVQMCTQFISTSHLDVFDPRDHSGNWKQITVRSSQEGEQMLVIQVYGQGVSREEVREECDRLCKQLTTPGSDVESASVNITSVYFQLCDSVNIGGPGGEMELLRGNRKLKEIVLGLYFCISPNAFFQVNTPAAQTLYDVIRENVPSSPQTVLLDLCCGTGTIGLCLAGRVGRVVGVELCQEAVEDAISNAALNGISNAEFLCGAVETVIHRIPEVSREECHVVAVLDPPRAGVSSQVISTLRKAKNVKRLIYVACNVANARQNLVDLCRPPSSRVGGSPFSLCRVTPVDLFPHTMHCELVLCYDHAS